MKKDYQSTFLFFQFFFFSNVDVDEDLFQTQVPRDF